MKKIAITLLAVSLMCWSCKKENSPVTPPPNPMDIVPLADHNEWRFVDSLYGSKLKNANRIHTESAMGHAYHSQGKTYESSIDSFKAYVSGRRTIRYGGSDVELFTINWYESLPQSVPDSLATLWLEHNESGGLYVFGFVQGTRDTIISKSLDLKYPVTVGDSWVRPGAYYYYETNRWEVSADTMTCSSTSEQFATLQRTYSAVVYRGKSGDFEFSEYYVPNLGLVGSISEFSGTIQSKSVLKSCTLH